jgi:hypothetical protein
VGAQGSESIYRNQTNAYGGSSLKESDITTWKYRIAVERTDKIIAAINVSHVRVPNCLCLYSIC